VDKWPEAREGLNVIPGWIIHLKVAAAQFDLRHGGDTGHRCGGIRQDHFACLELIREDAATGPHIDILPEFIYKTGLRNLSECRRNNSRRESQSKAEHNLAHPLIS
jgi:hypothetical protein